MIALILLVLPPTGAIAFVTVTSTPRDANVGGALYLVAGAIAGVALAAGYLSRQRRS